MTHPPRNPSSAGAADGTRSTPTRRTVLRGSLTAAAVAGTAGTAVVGTAPAAHASDAPPAETDRAGDTSTARHWRSRLATLAARHEVPGASLGILAGDRVVKVAAGLANADDRIEATPDTLWQIGSITKVWTATLAMRLVDEGAIDLDTPVVRHLPELRLPDPDRTRRLTLRHLLAHTSGIDGDVLPDTGRGDDCLERFTALLKDVPAVHPLGRAYSYCNVGLILAGRLIERRTGTTWDTALRERVIAPLGLTRSHTLPEDVLAHRAAAGHTSGPDGRPRVDPTWMPRSQGPCGIVCSSVGDVLAFVRLHLNDGLGPDGTRLLSARAAEEMRSFQTATPNTPDTGESWGLGWARWDWDGRAVYGHDGRTQGQSSYLRVLPDARLAVVLLTNGGDAQALYHDLYREIFTDLAGVAPRPPHAPDGTRPPHDAGGYLGRYQRVGVLEEILERGGALFLRRTFTGGTPSEFELLPAGRDLYVHRLPGVRDWEPLKCFTLDGTRYVCQSNRVLPQIS